MADTIWVKPGSPRKQKDREQMKNRVIVWEVNDAHPNGEIFIAENTPGPVEVAQTPAVLEAMRDGKLVETDRAGGTTRAAATADERDEKKSAGAKKDEK